MTNKTILMNKVVSSNIDTIGYDEDLKEMHVTFIGNTATYVYKNVPKEKYEELSKASSIGSCFAKEIRNVFIFDKP